jgi:pilus assembly protein FimV
MALLAPAAATAVSLGEIAIESSLGQPFSGRVPVDLSPGEVLGAACVSIARGDGDLAGLPQPAVRAPEANVPGRYELVVTTAAPLYEPMYELQLQVRCPGTALLVRQYVLMLDLPSATADGSLAAAAPLPAVALAPVAQSPSAADPAVVAPSAPDRPRRAAVAPAGTPLERGTRYTVVTGDTLSGIVMRLSDRNGSLWQVADEIMAANPAAFIDGNPDLIRLGSVIDIPAAAGTGPAPVAETTPATEATAATAQPTTGATTNVPPPAAPAAPTAAVADAVPPAPVELAPPAQSAGDAASVTPEQEPAAAVFLDEQAAAPTAAEPPADAADTELTAQPAPAPVQSSGAPGWLAALIGLLLGGLISAVLLRERLLASWRERGAARRIVSARAPAPAASAGVLAEKTVRERVRNPDSTMMVVEESAAAEDTVRNPSADNARTDELPEVRRTDELPAMGAGKVYAETGMDSDLSRLFGDESDLHAMDPTDLGVVPNAAELDLDLTSAAADATVDQEFDWMRDETALTPTTEMPSIHPDDSVTVEQLDLQTLAQHATSNERVSQTLEEALNLLENDYQEELTASQVLDRKRVERILNEDAEDTLIRTGTDKIRR